MRGAPSTEHWVRRSLLYSLAIRESRPTVHPVASPPTRAGPRLCVPPARPPVLSPGQRVEYLPMGGAEINTNQELAGAPHFASVYQVLVTHTTVMPLKESAFWKMADNVLVGKAKEQNRYYRDPRKPGAEPSKEPTCTNSRNITDIAKHRTQTAKNGCTFWPCRFLARMLSKIRSSVKLVPLLPSPGSEK